MTDGTPRPDVGRTLARLKDFQRASAIHVFRRLYSEKGNANRFLIADEVGLGKTVVARGVLAQAIDHLWVGTPRIDVLYICSNAEIARQNLRKLNPIEGVDVALASRITLLPITVAGLDANKVNIVSFTPSTSFDLKSTLGMSRERRLLFHLLRRAWDLGGAGAEHLFAGHVGIERFREGLRSFEADYPISEPLAAKFVQALDAHPELRARMDAILPAYARGRNAVSEENWEKGAALIGELRTLLAATCISALQPDIVILDEFQRFKGLLDGTDPSSTLAMQLFDYPGVRTLLLSATPYKMYTVRDEAGGEDHYRDFLQTLKFLFADPARSAQVERQLETYRRALRAAADGAGSHVRQARDDLEASLRSVMIRTERLAASEDRNGMLVQVDPVGLDLCAADVRDCVSLQRIARSLGHPDTLEYWKSAPYVLNFMDDYALKRAFLKAGAEAPSRRPLVDALGPGASSLLDWEEVQRYARLDPANARLRALATDTVGRGAWRLLWLPPALAYTEPGAPFDAAETSGLTKRLVFSSWRLVPKVVSALLSYEAERAMITSGEPDAANTSEARKRRAPLLRFNVDGEGRPSGMAVLGLVYPSSVLAKVGDPLALRAGRSAPVPLVEALSVVRDRLGSLLAELPGEKTEEGAPDEAWYWAAPILLDLHEGVGEGSLAGWWWRREDLASRWAGRDVESDVVRDPDAGESGTDWDTHVAEARRVVRGERKLGPMPADLPDVLARVAVGGPGACALRAARRRSPGGKDGSGSVFESWEAPKDAAGRIARVLRTLFNRPESIGLLRGLDGTEPYWRRVLDYAIAGNLQSVLDEYVHGLWEGLGLDTSSPEEAYGALAAAFEASAGLRTSVVGLDVLRVDAREGTIGREDASMRTRFASRLAEERAETGAGATRQDQVRAAFNSPFWPFVLTTTSVGQEGLDFHPYCHAVVHWNLPSNPVDLEQREGRVHRFKGHAVRKNLAARFATSLPAGLTADPWEELFRLGVEGRTAGASELEPFWILAGAARIERHVPALPLSRDARQLGSLRKALVVYRMVFGQPRQEELVAYLLSHVPKERMNALLAEARIDVSPPAVATPGASGLGVPAATGEITTPETPP